jgi:hypothetical protein
MRIRFQSPDAPTPPDQGGNIKLERTLKHNLILVTANTRNDFDVMVSMQTPPLQKLTILWFEVTAAAAELKVESEELFLPSPFQGIVFGATCQKRTCIEYLWVILADRQ